MSGELVRKCTAEAVGSAMLVAAVIGSGIAAVRLAPGTVGIQLLINSVVTGAVLVALILALQPVSAAFNPVVTGIERAHRLITTRTAVALVAAQLVGAAAGAVLANLMFSLPAVRLSAHHRVSAATMLAEVVATAGLVVVVFGTARSGRSERVAYAVGGYILAAYWFTSSTSFANPTVTLARILTDSFAGIAASSAVAFIGMQLLGGAVGYALVRVLFPTAAAVAATAATLDPTSVSETS